MTTEQTLGAPSPAAEKSARSAGAVPRDLNATSPHEERQPAIVTIPLPPVTGPDTAWWTTSRRRVFLDSHTPDWSDPHQRGNIGDPGVSLLSGVQPAQDLETLATAGVDSVVLFAKCQYGNSYYPTAVGRTHGALNGRDLFGEQIQAAHGRGIRVIAYFSNMWDTAAAGANPDWRLVPSPARGSTGRWPALCLLSPYRSHALRHVAEIAERYPIDGLWSDILTAGPCVCERCESLFRDRFGRAMPTDRRDPNWVDLIHFSQDIIKDYLAEQRDVLRSIRPQCALIPNFYATTFVDAVIGLSTSHLDLADIGSSEGYTDWHGLGFPSFAARYVSAGVKGRPSEVLVSRFVHTWDFTMRSEAQLRFEAFTVAAHGVTVSVDDQPYATGAIEPEVYRRLTTVFQTIAERTPWLEQATPERYVALYASQRARELESILGDDERPPLGEQSAQFPPSEPRTAASDLVAAVTGTYRSLVEAHLPVAIMDERVEALANLKDFAVLVLPDVLSLSDSEITTIDAFVRAGGGLVVTGEAGTRDARGQQQEMHPTLTELLGVRFGPAVDDPYPYLRLEGDWAENLGSWPIPHYGRIPQLIDVAPDVTTLATRIRSVLNTDESTYWHNNQPAPGVTTLEPIIVERSAGAGKVVVSAARLGNNKARQGHGTYRELITSLVQRVAPNPPAIEVVGVFPNTEVVVARQRDRLIVHLVTGHPVVALDVAGAAQPAAIEQVASLSEFTLRVAGALSAARVVAGAEHNLPIDDGLVTITNLTDWETLVFRLNR